MKNENESSINDDGSIFISDKALFASMVPPPVKTERERLERRLLSIAAEKWGQPWDSQKLKDLKAEEAEIKDTLKNL